MNDQWRPGISGGEIVLNPFPYPEVKIAPSFDRLVLFSSSEMLHRVLPSHEPRYCLTFWMYAHGKGNDEFMKNLSTSSSPTTTSVIEKFSTNLEQQQQESAQHDELMKSSLLEEAHAMNLMLSGSSNRKYFNRLAFASEWRQSIIESHFKKSSSSSSSSGTDSGSKQQHQQLLEEALERNDKEVQVILKSFTSFLKNQNYKYSNIASNPLDLITKYIPVSPTDQPGLVDWFPTHAR